MPEITYNYENIQDRMFQAMVIDRKFGRPQVVPIDVHRNHGESSLDAYNRVCAKNNYESIHGVTVKLEWATSSDGTQKTLDTN